MSLSSREQVLIYWFDIHKTIPVNWNDTNSIKDFKNSSEKYAKTWSKLDVDDQGWISEQISIWNKSQCVYSATG